MIQMQSIISRTIERVVIAHRIYTLEAELIMEKSVTM
jgi:hypothetical protein